MAGFIPQGKIIEKVKYSILDRLLLKVRGLLDIWVL